MPGAVKPAKRPLVPRSGLNLQPYLGIFSMWLIAGMQYRAAAGAGAGNLPPIPCRSRAYALYLIRLIKARS
ncbi:MAG: hypothetical protein LBT14_02670 [Treponema sp.]|nr:hypothetical protein [Treponema sp.]